MAVDKILTTAYSGRIEEKLLKIKQRHALQNLTQWKTNFLKLIPNRTKIAKKEKYIVISDRLAKSLDLHHFSNVVLSPKEVTLKKYFNKSRITIIGQIRMLALGDERVIRNYLQTVNNIFSAANPSFLIVNSSFNPFVRLFICVAKRHGVPVVGVQHGYFEKNHPHYYLEDACFDFYLGYDQNALEIVKRSYPENSECIFGGYIHPMGRVANKYQINTVVLIGEDHEQYSEAHRYEKLVRFYEKFIVAIKKSYPKIDILYRPHPSERSGRITAKRIAAEIDINRKISFGQAFIGMTSTLLMDASLQESLSIQILFEDEYDSNFSELGYAHTVTMRVDEEEIAFKKIIEIIKHNEIYSIRSTLIQSFRELINEVG
jgi:hypothetical protein